MKQIYKIRRYYAIYLCLDSIPLSSETPGAVTILETRDPAHTPSLLYISPRTISISELFLKSDWFTTGR